MLRYRLIRNLLILSLAIAIFLPGYDFLVVHPAYNELITEKTEDEAVRYASYMVRTLHLENQFLTKEMLPQGLTQSLKPVSRDRQLVKLRIFAANGEIIFSTQHDEIGSVNERDYFHDVVAKGQVYSKVVKKDRKTAEGDVSQIDIVETYVPFMVDNQFGGAFEVYYDITASVKKTQKLSFLSRVTSIFMSLAFLMAIFVALYRAYISLREREVAEEALVKANEGLEMRVAERTRELVDANELLTEQIAERIRAQNALADAIEEIRIDREKLEEILRSVPDGVVVTDGELKVLHMNVAAENILGVTLEEKVGNSIGQLSGNVDFIKNIGQRLNIGYASRAFDMELPCDERKKNCIYQVRISQFVPDEAESPGVVLLIRDVTREREVEQMKNAFLGMAAHELNTPLTTIIGYTELLTTEETAVGFDDKQKADYLQLIHDKALALGGLIDDLLDVSRVESGRDLTLHYQEFDLKETLSEVLNPYQEVESKHHFELLLPAAEARICADQTRLEQVVGHLISNAIKYSPDGGTVKVSLSLTAGMYELHVSDEGIGMNAEELAHVYDRFYRADSSDTAVQGVGLGMSIVRHIVLAHHGQIEVKSELGKGTEVVVSLPMMPTADHSEINNPYRT